MEQESLWILQAQKGNQRAFRELYEANVAMLFRFLRQFSPDPIQVEEWVQRAFINAFRHIASFEGRAQFSSWLFRIALNEMRSDLRRRKPHESVPIEDDSAVSVNYSGEFEWRETMKEWLGELDESKRVVFLLFEVEGYSHAEIAHMLGIAEGSSRSYLARARQYLQQQWNKEHRQ